MDPGSSNMQIPPFLSSSPMQGDPPCNWSDFLSPQLRRFPRLYNRVKMLNRLGYGIEGCVARVKFDNDNSSFAVKIFFDSVPDEDDSDWWPLEREARNVAILEKVQAGLRQSSPEPVYVPAKRTTRLDCLRCLYAFSADGRRSRAFDGLPAASKVGLVHSGTRLRKCFGWTRVRGADFMSMNDIIEIDRRAEEKGEGSASYIQQNKQYFAIVYEYVPESKLELDAVQRQLDFFHHIGFHPCQVMRKENWQGPGILLDFGDYNSPVDPWFAALNAYRPQPTAEIVIDPEAVEARGVELWNKQEELYRQGVRPTKEEKREKKRIEAMENTAELVERGYDAGRRYVSYFELTKEEILKNKLEEDPLSEIRILEIQPETVLRVWKAYNNQKKKYLAAVGSDSETNGA